MELEVRELNPMFDAMKEFSQTLDRAKELSEAISKGVYEQSSVVAKEVGQLSGYRDSNDYSVFPQKPWLSFLLNDSQNERLESMKEGIDREIEAFGQL